MEAQTIEDMIPNTLRITLNTLLIENVLINYKIFGGDVTVISLKFGPHMEASAAEPPMHSHNNKPFQPQMQCFRRKSPASIDRDIRRLDTWKSKPYVSAEPCVDIVNTIGEEGKTHDSGQDMSCSDVKQTLHFGCEQDDSGIVNSNMVPNRSVSSPSNANICETSIQTESHGIYESTPIHLNANVATYASGVQTERPTIANRETQTNRTKSKRIQTNPCKMLTLEKALQTLPTAASSMTQTNSIVKHGQDNASMTYECVKQSKGTATPPPTDKHTQTFQCSSRSISIQASETFTKGSQTLTKKELKSQKTEATMSTGLTDMADMDTESNRTVQMQTTADASFVRPSGFDAVVHCYDNLITKIEKLQAGTIK